MVLLKVVFSIGSSSFNPWAMHAVACIVSVGDGWSSKVTLLALSSSPRSISHALADLLDLAGLTLIDPFEEVTACLNSSYWVAETRRDELSSSTSDMDLSLACWSAVMKLIGDANLSGNLDEGEEVCKGDLDLNLPRGDSASSLDGAMMGDGEQDWECLPVEVRWTLLISTDYCDGECLTDGVSLSVLPAIDDLGCEVVS